MRCDRTDLLLYLVTDRSWLGSKPLEQQVEECIQAGASFVQLREKELDQEQFIAAATRMKAVTDRYHVPFVINDNIEVALAVDADGVHVGQSDRTAREVRCLLGADKILGVSVQTVEQALQAEQAGADYLGVGAVFSTATKSDADVVSLETRSQICQAVRIPVVAIGGIQAHTIQALRGTGIDGVAVISAILAAKEIRQATQTLLALAKGCIG